jgi:PAS domain S-box-containing protein
MDQVEPTTLLLEYTQDKIAIVEPSGTYTYVNAAAKHILGYEPEQLVGENAFEYIHPDDRAAVREQFEALADTDSFEADTATYRYQTSDGGWAWLESQMSNLRDSELGGYVVSSRDVTDREVAERERRESRDRLAELAETTDDVLWVFDGDWSELLFCNPAYEDLFGRPVEELEGDPRSFLECVYPPDRPVVEEAMNRLANGEPADQEIRVNPTTGYNRWIWVQGEPIRQDGEVVRIAGFSRDVTHRRRRERQLGVIDNFLRHNIRNQLNVVLGNVETLEANPDADAAERVALIRRAGETLLKTAEKQREIVDILTDRPRTATTNLGDIVENAVRPLQDRFPTAVIGTDVTDVVVGAPSELQCAVAELVENAICHTHGTEPTVEVSVRTRGDHVDLVVADNGPPIPAADRRVLLGDHEMTPVDHSRGVGLWLVYWVVDIANGSIDHEFDEHGNTVTLTLQRAD